jgi:hypothetical protein
MRDPRTHQEQGAFSPRCFRCGGHRGLSRASRASGSHARGLTSARRGCRSEVVARRCGQRQPRGMSADGLAAMLVRARSSACGNGLATKWFGCQAPACAAAIAVQLYLPLIPMSTRGPHGDMACGPRGQGLELSRKGGGRSGLHPLCTCTFHTTLLRRMAFAPVSVDLGYGHLPVAVIGPSVVRGRPLDSGNRMPIASVVGLRRTTPRGAFGEQVWWEYGIGTTNN